VKFDYKWVALSNTTLGMLLATINSSILLIALPDIFRGIGIDPLAPGNTSYLLWLILGFLVVMAVLLVSLGRLGDIYGRVRMFNLGFAVHRFSILLSVTWRRRCWALVDPDGSGRAWARAAVRELERDPDGCVPATSAGRSAQLDAAIAGSFLGSLGGVLAPIYG
jgi:MFS family permease